MKQRQIDFILDRFEKRSKYIYFCANESGVGLNSERIRYGSFYFKICLLCIKIKFHVSKKNEMKTFCFFNFYRKNTKKKSVWSCNFLWKRFLPTKVYTIYRYYYTEEMRLPLKLLNIKIQFNFLVRFCCTNWLYMWDWVTKRLFTFYENLQHTII